MASVHDLQLPPALRSQLLARGLRTARECLHHTAGDLCELLDLPHAAAQQLLLDVAAQTAPGYITASQLYSLSLLDSTSQLRTFLPSQFAMSLALSAALPRALGGLAATVMYIDTEGKLSVPRMQEMALARAASIMLPQLVTQPPPGDAAAPGGGAGGAQPPRLSDEELQEMAMSALDRVLIIKPGSLDALRATLAALEAQMLERGEAVGRQAVALKTLAECHRIPIVVTNQVTSRPTGPAVHAFQGGAAPATDGADNGHLAAALGTKWAHSVNVRLVLERQGTQRFIKIAKSPLSPNVAFEYAITPAGVQQVGAGPAPPQAFGGAGVVAGSALAMPIVNTRPPEAGWGDGGDGCSTVDPSIETRSIPPRSPLLLLNHLSRRVAARISDMETGLTRHGRRFRSALPHVQGAQQTQQAVHTPMPTTAAAAAPRRRGRAAPQGAAPASEPPPPPELLAILVCNLPPEARRALMAVSRAARAAAGAEVRAAKLYLPAWAKAPGAGRRDCAALDSALRRAAAARPHLESVELVVPKDDFYIDLDENTAIVMGHTPSATQHMLLAAAALLPLRGLRCVVVRAEDTTVSVQPLVALSQLASLDLGACLHPIADLQHFPALASLTELRLSGVCPPRKPFDLPGCGGAYAPMHVARKKARYSAADIAALAQLPALRALTIGLPGGKEPSFLPTIAGLTRLHSLTLAPLQPHYSTSGYSVDGICALARLTALTRLETPWLTPRGSGSDSDADAVPAGAWAIAFGGMQRLEALALTFIWSPPAEGAATAIGRCSSLQELHLGVSCRSTRSALFSSGDAAALSRVPRIVIVCEFKGAHYALEPITKLPTFAFTVNNDSYWNPDARAGYTFAARGEPCCCGLLVLQRSRLLMLQRAGPARTIVPLSLAQLRVCAPYLSCCEAAPSCARSLRQAHRVVMETGVTRHGRRFRAAPPQTLRALMAVSKAARAAAGPEIRSAKLDLAACAKALGGACTGVAVAFDLERTAAARPRLESIELVIPGKFRMPAGMPAGNELTLLAVDALLPLGALRRMVVTAGPHPHHDSAGVHPLAALRQLASLDAGGCLHPLGDLQGFTALRAFTLARVRRPGPPFDLPGCGGAFAPVRMAAGPTLYALEDIASLACLPALRELATRLQEEPGFLQEVAGLTRLESLTLAPYIRNSCEASTDDIRALARLTALTRLETPWLAPAAGDDGDDEDAAAEDARGAGPAADAWAAAFGGMPRLERLTLMFMGAPMTAGAATAVGGVTSLQQLQLSSALCVGRRWVPLPPGAAAALARVPRVALVCEHKGSHRSFGAVAQLPDFAFVVNDDYYCGRRYQQDSYAFSARGEPCCCPECELDAWRCEVLAEQAAAAAEGATV
ncbi:MAG: hypothetical protein J3K34DRAFT_514052 [Monoraphidium minutum]|nr:MAG: hypothetical protein J3K34DRAFT_514052 [Monoraphidium minutum]